MELNGEVWNFGHFIKNDFYCNSQSFILRHLAPFDRKFLQIGTLRAKYLRKNVQERGSTPVPPLPPVIRVVLVLLHIQGDRVILFFLKCMPQKLLRILKTNEKKCNTGMEKKAKNLLLIVNWNQKIHILNFTLQIIL